MNKINRKIEYALMALKHMSTKKPGELTSAKEVCDIYHCPFDATSRVMQVMAQKEILKSEQGVYGGYQIIRDLNKVSFFELSEMIVGPVALAKCLSAEDDGACDLSHTCNIQTPMQMLNTKLAEFYRALYVADILDSRNRSKTTRTAGANHVS
jgi:Rrf2 family nitric oxide-sensitive transcriptional repressor